MRVSLTRKLAPHHTVYSCTIHYYTQLCGLVPQVVNVRVSLNRLHEMLLAPELENMLEDASGAPHNATGTRHNGAVSGLAQSQSTAVEVHGASFSWAVPGAEGEEGGKNDAQVSVPDVDLVIERGALVAIVGATGAYSCTVLCPHLWPQECTVLYSCTQPYCTWTLLSNVGHWLSLLGPQVRSQNS